MEHCGVTLLSVIGLMFLSTAGTKDATIGLGSEA